MVHSAIKGFMQQTLMEIQTQVNFKSEKIKIVVSKLLYKSIEKSEEH